MANFVKPETEITDEQDSSGIANSVNPETMAEITDEQDGSVATNGTMMVFKGKRNLDEADRPLMVSSLLAPRGSTSQIIKEFDGADLRSWVQDLSDEMAVACCLAIKDLKVSLKEKSTKFLTMDEVEIIFNNCDYIVKDETSLLNNINDSKAFEEKDLTNTNISSWIRDFFRKQDKQTMPSNSPLVEMVAEESFLDKLAAKVIEYRAEELLSSAYSAKAKILKLGAILFSGTEDILRLASFQVFKLFDNGVSIIEVEYKGVDFRPFSAAIDTTIASKASEKLRIQETFDF